MSIPEIDRVSQPAVPTDRLTEIESKVECLVAYYDLSDEGLSAEDDVLWLIREVKRLRTNPGEAIIEG